MNASQRLREQFVESFMNAVKAYGGDGKGYTIEKNINMQGGYYSVYDAKGRMVCRNVNAHAMGEFNRILTDAAQTAVNEVEARHEHTG